MEKAPDAFRTISEVADDLDLPQHVLRFWETRFAQIKPLKRGGGRRYYRPDDIDLLRGIRHLLYGEGYTIKGVQRLLKDHGSRAVQQIMKPAAAVTALPPPDPRDADGGEALDGEIVAPALLAPEGDMPFHAPAPPPRAGLQDYTAGTVSIVRGGLGRRLSALPPRQKRAELPAPTGASVDEEVLRIVLQELLEVRKALDAALER